MTPSSRPTLPRSQLERQPTLMEASRALTSGPGPREVLHAVVPGAVRVIRAAEAGVLFQRDAARAGLRDAMARRAT